MATTGDGKTFLPSVATMDANSSAFGPDLDAIHKALVNNDSALMALYASLLQAATPSGVIGLSAITAGTTSTPNQYSFADDNALITGMIQAMKNNLVILDAPPASNVTPSLPGSARDDLVFYEFWRSILGVQSGHIRIVDGIDFATYPEGINQTALVKAQGGAASPTTYTYAQSSTDKGVYVAGDGSAAAQTALGSSEGKVYAIVLFRVRRRNNAGFDPDTNPNGGQTYFTVYFSASSAIAPQATATISFSASDYANLNVGQVYTNAPSNTVAFSVESLNGNNQATVKNICGSPIQAGAGAYTIRSDRPDGLYSNIIDASDITDLRHQVSLTGFNNQALPEKSLDLLLRGQLTTNAPTRYGRDYIGLQYPSDDVNTILYCSFNGTINASANGSSVTGSTNTGSPSYTNGIQGAAFKASTSVYTLFSISGLAQGANTYNLEFAIKPTWNWVGASSSHGILRLFDASSNKLLEVYVNTGGNLYVVPFQAGSALGHCYGIASRVALIKAGDWVYIKISVNNGVVSMTVNDIPLDITYLNNPGTNAISALSSSVASCNIGASENGYLKADIDFVRISNITRSSTPLPVNFDPYNGDRILDGPNTDFTTWSDDVGSTAGVGGRTNPYGLSRVPNQIAARVSYNGQEVKHYFGQGLTPGWSGSGFGITAPTGSAESNGETIGITANEVADGVKTTFTFSKPSNTLGIFALTSFVNAVQVNSGWVTPSSMSYDATSGTVTAILSAAPTNGQAVKLLYGSVTRHAHLIPSTKGFVMYDWNDDSLAADGSVTTFRTTKFAVTGVNQIRTAPTATPNIQAIQNGGFTVQGANCATTLTANAVQNATQIQVNGANTTFFTGQTLRISDGNGGWVTTSVSGAVTGSAGAYLVPVTALSAAVTSGATVQGTAQVTFATAPFAGTPETIQNTVSGTITQAGNGTMLVTAVGMTGSPVTVPVNLALNDTAGIIAGKIVAALQGNANINGFFNISASGAVVTMTAKVAAANDPTMQISWSDGTTIGLTSSTSTIITQGVANGSGTVDIVYESVLTPAKGDYIRVMYQHTPYQGVGKDSQSLQVLARAQDIKTTTFGTGVVKSSGFGGLYTNPITPSLPTGQVAYDYLMKCDAVYTTLAATDRLMNFWLEGMPAVPHPSSALSNLYPLRQGSIITLAVSGTSTASRGLSATKNSGFISYDGPPLNSSIPHISIFTALCSDSNSGELYLLVATTYKTDTTHQLTIDGNSNGAIDIFKLPGRPLIKNYGGVAA